MMTIQIIILFFVIFQTFKNTILRSVESLGLVPLSVHLSWSKQTYCALIPSFVVDFNCENYYNNFFLVIFIHLDLLKFFNFGLFDLFISSFLHFSNSTNNNIHTFQGLGRHIITLKADVDIFHEVLKPLLIVIMASCHLKCHLTTVWIQTLH